MPSGIDFALHGALIAELAVIQCYFEAHSRRWLNSSFWAACASGSTPGNKPAYSDQARKELESSCHSRRILHHAFLLGLDWSHHVFLYPCNSLHPYEWEVDSRQWYKSVWMEMNGLLRPMHSREGRRNIFARIRQHFKFSKMGKGPHNLIRAELPQIPPRRAIRRSDAIICAI